MSLTTAEAARRLGVSAHEVRRLIERGDLLASKRGVWLIDDASVDQRIQARPGRGRPLAPHTAWAALMESSGERADWLDAATRSRLRAWLRGRDAEAVSRACRRRAVRHDRRVLPAYREELLASRGVVRGGLSAASIVGADLVLMGDTDAEVYCDAGTLASLTMQFGLSQLGAANVTLRVVNWPDARLLSREAAPAAVVAVDLMEASDFRTRRAGGQLLTALLATNLAPP